MIAQKQAGSLFGKEKDDGFKSSLNAILQTFDGKYVKPTLQGTGLGLSLSYDIVKAHGGEIRAESKEGEGSLFIINISTT